MFLHVYLLTVKNGLTTYDYIVQESKRLRQKELDKKAKKQELVALETKTQQVNNSASKGRESATPSSHGSVVVKAKAIDGDGDDDHSDGGMKVTDRTNSRSEGDGGGGGVNNYRNEKKTQINNSNNNITGNRQRSDEEEEDGGGDGEQEVLQQVLSDVESHEPHEQHGRGERKGSSLGGVGGGGGYEMVQTDEKEAHV